MNSDEICVFFFRYVGREKCAPSFETLEKRKGKKVPYLEGQFARVAQNKALNFTRNGIQLLQDGQDEHGSFPHSALSLANDVHSQDGLWNTFVLHYCW